MQTVEVVIRIPKIIYEDLFNKELQDWFIESEVNFFGLRIGKAIQNGTVLPKGHGRLGDIDFEVKHYESILDNPTPDVTRYDRKTAPIILKALRMIGPVIGADREVQDEK